MDREAPIGVFDSGVGGLSIVAALQKQLPSERFFYLGDTARAPYGSLKGPSLLRHAFACATFLYQKGVKLIVIACNTLSAFALAALQERFPIPIVGVIQPACQLALTPPFPRRLGILATPSTIRSGAYTQLLERMGYLSPVTLSPAPRLASFVERNQSQSLQAQRALESSLTPFLRSPVDKLILGCTHFPIYAPQIQSFLGEQTQLINPATPTALFVQEQLKQHALSSPQGEGSIQYWVTQSPQRFCQAGRALLNSPHPLTASLTALPSSSALFPKEKKKGDTQEPLLPVPPLSRSGSFL